MTQYFCSECHEPTQPRLAEVGPVASCHSREEAGLMVIDDREPLFSEEISITLVKAWASNWSYDRLHTYFAAPQQSCWCDACERGRQWQAEAAILDEDDPNWDAQPLRDLTDSELADLTEELWLDEQADWSPAMRARERVMRGE